MPQQTDQGLLEEEVVVVLLDEDCDCDNAAASFLLIWRQKGQHINQSREVVKISLCPTHTLSIVNRLQSAGLSLSFE